MVSRRWLAPVFALLCVVSPVVAQATKPRNVVEEKLKPGRLEMPEGVDPSKFNQMRNGNIALNNPTDAERAVLEGMAKQFVYPITHFEFYSTSEPSNAELTPRPDEKTVGRLINDLRARLVVITPGDNAIPAPKVDFAREFGRAAVKAIDDVLAKGPHPVVRMNVIHMLGVIAESGAPAAAERITKLLADKDKLPVEALYAALQAAEEAIAKYDPARSAVAQNWVTKNMYFELVSLVDDVVQKVPASVAANTYQPDATGTGTLTTDPKPAPTTTSPLTPEQVATVQAFRLQAVRALAQVKTDVVYDDKREKQRRTLVTLARVAVRDTSLVPVPSNREVGEAVYGMANATPTDTELDARVLAVAMARGLSEFAAPKAAAAARGGETGPQMAHWKLTGARLKNVFQSWDATAVARSRLDQPSKALLREFTQLALAQVLDPLSKQSDNGTVVGLQPGEIDAWRTKKEGELKALQLYKDSDKTKLSPR